MSTWRRKAIELFPDLRDEFQAPDATIYTVFFELLPRCVQAHAEGNTEELEKIYGCATWCARQKEEDLWNAAGVAFYEHIIDCREAVQAFHRWVEPDVFRDVSSLLELQMGEERFEKLKSDYEMKRRRWEKRG